MNAHGVELVRTDLHSGLRQLCEENPESDWLRMAAAMNGFGYQMADTPPTAHDGGRYSRALGMLLPLSGAGLNGRSSLEESGQNSLSH